MTTSAEASRKRVRCLARQLYRRGAITIKTKASPELSQGIPVLAFVSTLQPDGDMILVVRAASLGDREACSRHFQKVAAVLIELERARAFVTGLLRCLAVTRLIAAVAVPLTVALGLVHALDVLREYRWTLAWLALSASTSCLGLLARWWLRRTFVRFVQTMIA